MARNNAKEESSALTQPPFRPYGSHKPREHNPFDRLRRRSAAVRRDDHGLVCRCGQKSSRGFHRRVLCDSLHSRGGRSGRSLRRGRGGLLCGGICESSFEPWLVFMLLGLSGVAMRTRFREDCFRNRKRVCTRVFTQTYICMATMRMLLE